MRELKNPTMLRMTTVPMSLKHLISGQVKNAKENGFDVVMASSDGIERDEIIQIEGVDHTILPFERDISLLKDIQALFATIKLIRKVKPDIVHTHTPKAGLIGMLAAFICRVPLRIHTVAGMPLESLKGIKKTIVILTEKLTYRCATNVWPNSKSMKSYILDNKFLHSSKVEIIGSGSSNGIDISEYNTSNLDLSILEELRRKHFYRKATYFLSIGRVVRQKGIEELVDAFLMLNSSKPEENLVLVVVGPYEDERDPISDRIRNIIKSDNNIIEVGYSDLVKYFFALSDAFIFPSHREGFPNVLLQAGAMKCPILCSRIKGNIDIVEDKKTGILFEVNNMDSILSAMNHFLENRLTTDNYVKVLHDKIIRSYDRKKVQALIILKYKELLNR